MRLFIWTLSATLLAVPTAPSAETDPDVTVEAVSRFLARREPPVERAVALRHLEATTRGGSMTGWIDACTTIDGQALRYWIVGEGGSGAVRKRALVAALDGEIKARREASSRAALDPANYDFAPEIPDEGLLRVGLKPRRKDSMLIEGNMFLSPDGADLIRIEGRLVKAPSFWTRHVSVVRRYARTAGVRVPVSMESTAKVLIVGTSTFAMTYRYLSINGEPVPQESEFAAGTDAQVCAQAPPGNAQ